MKMCPNCNEWLEDNQKICPHCGLRQEQTNTNTCQTIDNNEDFAKQAKESIKKVVNQKNPWIIASIVIANVAVVLTFLDILISEYCWSCYPIILAVCGYYIARMVVLKRDLDRLFADIRRCMSSIAVLILAYALIIHWTTNVGQSLGFLVCYVLPIIYIAYIIAVLVRYAKGGIGKANVVLTMVSIIGICLAISIVGGLVLDAQGFALALCIIPSILSILLALNIGLIGYLKLKKQVDDAMNDKKDKNL